MPLFAIPFPALDPVAISLGPFAIRWYALAYIVGLLIGWRYCLALAGRAALARGEHRSAVGLLRRALDANHADPELRAELALALEGIGEREQALEEWRWVELAAVDPRHRELARERLAGEERGR